MILHPFKNTHLLIHALIFKEVGKDVSRKKKPYLLRSRRNTPPMADHEAVNEQLKKDNEDLRK
jgi:hypothetical protein